MRRKAVIRNIGNVCKQLLIVIGILAGASLVAVFIKSVGFPVINAAVVYVLSVLLVARFTRGYFYGILASLLCMANYNFFFTQPYYTFNVYDVSDIITISVMLIASILTSTLTSKLLHASKLAKERESQTNMLYQITSSLAKASGVSDVAAVSVQCLSNLLDADVLCFMSTESNNKRSLYQARKDDRRIQISEVDHAQIDGYITGKNVIPIGDPSNQYGVICIPATSALESQEREKLVPAIIMQIQSAMDREKFSEEKKIVKIEMEHEKFRGNLLRAISHDLRTPLAGISGTAEVMMTHLEKQEDRNLAEGIFEETIWLTQMVENILSLTKIEEGRLILREQPEAVEEIVGEAIKHARKFAGQRKILADIPEEVLLVSMDGKLILQVLVNLLDNAIKHTQDDGIIQIKVHADNNRVWFSVADNGSGIKPQDMSYLFDSFYIAKDVSRTSRSGIGLGLSIVRAIVQAHGGRVYAENNKSGGAFFRFYLPVKERDRNE